VLLLLSVLKEEQLLLQTTEKAEIKGLDMVRTALHTNNCRQATTLKHAQGN
jgi:hypothetical protein